MRLYGGSTDCPRIGRRSLYTYPYQPPSHAEPVGEGGLSGAAIYLNSGSTSPSVGPSTVSAIGVHTASIAAAPGAAGRLVPRRLAPCSTQLYIDAAVSSASLLGAGPVASTCLITGHTFTPRRSCVAARFMIAASDASVMKLLNPV